MPFQQECELLLVNQSSAHSLLLKDETSTVGCQQPLSCGSEESLSTFPNAAAFSTPLSHSLHFLTTVSSTSPSSSSYSTSSYLYWSFKSDILTMAVMSCSALSALATGAQPLDAPCVFLDGKTRLCRKSAEAQHFCCFAIICFSRFLFWMTRMASGVRLRVNWISFFPSSLPWNCLLESMELDRRTPSDSWGLGTASQEHFPWVSWPAPAVWVGLLLFSCWVFRPKFLKFADVQEMDCFSLSDPAFSLPALLVSSDWEGSPLAFFFPNSSLPGEEIRWWRLMGGKGIFFLVWLEAIRVEKCASIQSAAEERLRKATRGALRALSKQRRGGGERLQCTCCPRTHCEFNWCMQTHWPAALWPSRQGGVAKGDTPNKATRKSWWCHFMYFFFHPLTSWSGDAHADVS